MSEDLFSASFCCIAFCNSITKSDLGSSVLIALLLNLTSSGFTGSLPWNIAVGEHPIDV